ncbi:hypothetical protein ANN_08813 [Periplaneta americana]|uniref:Uncharacterized protein n=1 Tax=Periplaneta americana TaxID=6978 RepID=A0ABQ8T2G5_PERAM|nr:hypothetical protein ANN_08813 [Periplaneta americana]
MLQHPPYSPDLALSDFHLFGSMKKFLAGHRFATNAEVQSILHDEEILAGWTPEDSNLNTKCQFCGKATVPFLTVNIVDYRAHPMMENSSSLESISQRKGRSPTAGGSTSSIEGDTSSPSMKSHQLNASDQGIKLLPAEQAPVELEPITVPYLNPLVLRKEFENILHNEGDACLTQPCFVDEHPIIYWNMSPSPDDVNCTASTASSFDWRPDPLSACDVILQPPQINGICSQFMCLNLLHPQPEEHATIDSMTHQGAIYPRELHFPGRLQSTY